MNEDEAGAEATEKKRIPLWPSVVMLIMMFVYWFFIYNNFFLLMIAIVMTFYWFSCLLACPCMLAFGLRYSICVLIPVLLPVISGLVFIPLSFVMTVTTPIRKTLFHSRDYVEFFIYDRCHHIKAQVRKSGYRYQEWEGELYQDYGYEIVYDPTDKTAAEPVQENLSVLRIGDHFYFIRASYIWTELFWKFFAH